eukprot:8792761-Pyramimonas_sp.AAC.1
MQSGKAGQYEGLFKTMLEFLGNPTALAKRPRRDPPAPAAAAAPDVHHVPGAWAGQGPGADVPPAAGDGPRGG